MPTKRRGFSVNTLAEAFGRDRRAVTRICADHDATGKRGNVKLYDPVEIAKAIVRLHGKKGDERELWRGDISPLADWELARLTPELRQTLRRAEALAAA